MTKKKADAQRKNKPGAGRPAVNGPTVRKEVQIPVVWREEIDRLRGDLTAAEWIRELIRREIGK